MRYQKLINRNWGPCDKCGLHICEFYLIESLDRKTPGTCVCAKCVPNDSDEIPMNEWIFGLPGVKNEH